MKRAAGVGMHVDTTAEVSSSSPQLRPWQHRVTTRTRSQCNNIYYDVFDYADNTASVDNFPSLTHTYDRFNATLLQLAAYWHLPRICKQNKKSESDL